MKRILTSIAALLLVASAANAADSVYINEVLPNSPGSDTGNEYFELRGTPNMSLAGYYLLNLEGQGATTTPGRGDVNQFWNLSSFSLGANGYLFARQTGSAYTVADANTTVVTSDGGGWQSTFDFYHGDGTQADFENGPNTVLLIKVESGYTPPAYTGGQATDDLDTNNDGFLDLPAGWTVVDSVGYMDGTDASASVCSYAAITFRAPNPSGVYQGICPAYGNIIDVPGPLTTTAGTFYVGRKAESTGSTTNDWVGTIVDGAAGTPLNFVFKSASDLGFNGSKLQDMVYGGLNLTPAPLGTLSYTPTINGTRFTTNTIVTPGGPVGDVAVDPRDNTTILFTIDNDVGMGIYRAYKVASGNWWLDSTPVVTGIGRFPCGLVVETNGTLWWVQDYDQALVRLKAPWSANTPELVVTNFGPLTADDDPGDLAFAPANFAGPPGQPGWLVIADKGSDDNAYNALNLQDPATTVLDQINNNFLVAATVGGLGFNNVVAIDALPQSGEVVTLSVDGYISAVNGSGTTRLITPSTVIVANGESLAVDPTTGRIWVADDTLEEVWSVDPSTGADTKELSFPLVDPPVVFRAFNMHDPGMAFSTNGAFLVVSDTSTAGGGGRLIIFHSEEYAPFALENFSITNVTQTVSGPLLEWSMAGPASFNLKYVIQRSTDVASAGSFSTIATVTATSYTDTSAPAGAAFYRILAKP